MHKWECTPLTRQILLWPLLVLQAINSLGAGPMARTTATTLGFTGGGHLAAQLVPLVPPRQQSRGEWSCQPQPTYEPCDAIKAGLCLPATCQELVRGL